MLDVLVEMAVLIACGVLWRALMPGDLNADAVRHAVTGLVYYLLWPALVLWVMWRTPLTLDSARISLVGISGVVVGMGLGWLICWQAKASSTVTGAVILATAFPNVTYLGLPVLEATLGAWSRSVAIQYDLFATAPMVLTVGMLVAQYYGTAVVRHRPFISLLRVPALWAAIVAIILNRFSVPAAGVAEAVLERLASAVIPLMLLALGMSLRWAGLRSRNISLVLPIIAIQLLMLPVWVWYAGSAVGMTDDILLAMVLEAAMPCMVIGIVICDRFGLDTALYAAATTLTTLASVMTLPLWFDFMQRQLRLFYGA